MLSIEARVTPRAEGKGQGVFTDSEEIVRVWRPTVKAEVVSDYCLVKIELVVQSLLE